MSEYTKMLHEIEAKKSALEARIVQVVSEEIAKWQSENSLAVQAVYIDLVDEQTLGSPKKYIVTGASVDIDYKP